VAKSRNDILFRFLGDTKSLDKASARAKGGFKKTQGAASSLKTMVGGLGLAIGAQGLVRSIGSAISRAEEMDSQYAITEKIIEDTGGAAGLTANQIKVMNREMAETTGIDKAVLTQASNVMLTFANVKDTAGEMNDVFSRSVELTADMATVFGGSAVDSAKQLGKALNDPIKGVTALSRTGVQFTDQQKKQIKVLVESGKTLEAQKLILEELDTQVGGTAAASADATAIMARSFDEVTEAIGAELLPTVKEITPIVSKAAKASIPLVGALAREFADAAGGVVDLAGNVEDAADETQSFGKRAGAAAEGLGTLVVEGLKWNVATGLIVRNLETLYGKLQIFGYGSRDAAEAQWELAQGTHAAREAMRDSVEAGAVYLDFLERYKFRTKEADDATLTTISKLHELEEAFRIAEATNDPYGIWNTDTWAKLWGNIDTATAKAATFADVVNGFRTPKDPVHYSQTTADSIDLGLITGG